MDDDVFTLLQYLEAHGGGYQLSMLWPDVPLDNKLLMDALLQAHAFGFVRRGTDVPGFDPDFQVEVTSKGRLAMEDDEDKSEDVWTIAVLERQFNKSTE
jgi:hypothetical protein